MSKTKKRKTGKIIFISILIVLVLTPIIMAQVNYGKNAITAQAFSVFDAEGYIQDQGATQVFNYGFNTSNKSGCGWIATYNVLTYLYNEGLYEEQVKVEDVIKPLDAYGTFGYGFLGTNPLAIQLFLRSKGLDVKITINQDKFYETAKTSDISVIVYFGRYLTYGHYQMIEYNEGNDDFILYNPSYTNTMEEYLTNHQNDYVFLLTINA